jgi:hypothetical protein
LRVALILVDLGSRVIEVGLDRIQAFGAGDPAGRIYQTHRSHIGAHPKIDKPRKATRQTGDAFITCLLGRTHDMSGASSNSPG